MIEQILTITFMTGMLAATIRMATPILITALGEMISERAGILNLGIEGIMIVGAFFGFWISFISGNLWLGLVSGGVAGAIFGLIMGIASIRYHANQIVTGVGIWILCSGLSSFLNRRVFGVGSDNRHISTLESIQIPFLSQIPILGETLFNQNIIVYLAILLIPLSVLLLNKTSWGLNINAAGENPRAADAAGVNIRMVRYLAVIYGGMMAGLGGAYLPIAFYGLYTDDLSMGRGWMAIAVVVFGRWAPWGILGGSLIFGAASALQYRLQALNFPLPYQFILMLPYVVTLIFVILFVKGETGPSALARPYSRSEIE